MGGIQEFVLDMKKWLGSQIFKVLHIAKLQKARPSNPYGRRTYLEGIQKLIIANTCAGARVAAKLERNRWLAPTNRTLIIWDRRYSVLYSLILCLRPTTESSLVQWAWSVFGATMRTLLIRRERNNPARNAETCTGQIRSHASINGSTTKWTSGEGWETVNKIQNMKPTGKWLGSRYVYSKKRRRRRSFTCFCLKWTVYSSLSLNDSNGIE